MTHFKRCCAVLLTARRWCCSTSRAPSSASPWPALLFRLALDIGNKAIVLQRGSVVFEGSCVELQQQPELLSGAYLARS